MTTATVKTEGPLIGGPFVVELPGIEPVAKIA
jgi:hypothetical protein